MMNRFVIFSLFFLFYSCGLNIQKGVKDTKIEQIEEKVQTPVQYRQVKDSAVHRALFQRGKAQMEKRQFPSALGIFKSYISQNPKGEFIDRVHIYLGQIHLINAKAPRAEERLQEVLLLSPPSPYRATAQHYLARAYHAQGNNKKALDLVAQVRLDEFYFQDEEHDFFAFWARLSEGGGRYLESTLAYLKTLEHSRNSSETLTVRNKVGRIIREHLSFEEVDYLLKKYDDPKFPAALLRLKMAEQFLMKGDSFSAKSQLGIIYQNYPSNSPYYVEAKRLEGRVGFASETKSASFKREKIGALMTFTGRGAAYGRNIREGLELSLYQERGVSSGIQVVYQDPGLTPQSVIAATERLIREEGVMAILGPVNGDLAEQSAHVAAQYGVPFISLSPRGGLSEKSNFVFEFSLNPDKQIRALVDFSFQELAARRFAIIFPEDNFGKSYARAFFDNVARVGGRVTAAESYNPRQVDFKPHVENMVGTALRHFRKDEWEEMLRSAEEKKGKKLSAKEIRDLKLAPIVDFDVLFIPDTYKALGQIAPSLAYADIDATLLGPATWNNVNTLRRAGQYLDGAYFVDVFSHLDKRQETFRFINLFKERYQKTPGPLSALGFDLGNVLKRVHHSPTPVRDRKELLSRLTRLGSYNGVLGIHDWNEKRNALSELKLFQVKRSTFNYVKSIRIQ